MHGARRFQLTVALVFLASATVTVVWCGSMTGMPGMQMPGGWTMSMTWMRMPGQGWAHTAAAFIGMWTVMMVAMMLPALAPVLKRNRLPFALGYFAAWTSLGAALFPVGLALAALEMKYVGLARAVPVAAAGTLVLAGALQASGWKARQLACCHRAARCTAAAGPWYQGWRLGLRCITCCAPITALLLVAGVMNLGAMAAATAAITVERLMPAGARIARINGLLLMSGGTWLLFT
jgi:predicted metal-binding membrane protein